MFAATITTAAGPFTIVATEGDEVLASGWTDSIDELLPQVHKDLRPRHVETRTDLGPLTDAAAAYHEGVFTAIDGVAVLQRSGPYREHAWAVLRSVPAGPPISYADYAARTGRPTAVRAAAGACAQNAAALFVPCHRVVRTDGSLGGFRWGLEVKSWLLEHEYH